MAAIITSIREADYPFAKQSSTTTLGLTPSIHSDFFSVFVNTSCWTVGPIHSLAERSIIRDPDPTIKRDPDPIEQIEIYREKLGNIKIILKMGLDKYKGMIYYAMMRTYLMKQKILFSEREFLFKERIFYVDDDSDARKLLKVIRDTNGLTTEAQKVIETALAPGLVGIIPTPERKESDSLKSDDIFTL